MSDPEYSYPGHYHLYPDVGTLGDPTNPATCSQVVLAKLNRTDNPVYYPAFEDAVEDVLSGELSTVMVPAAYRQVASFIQNQALQTVEVLLHPIPPLVVCSEQEMSAYTKLICYFQPATESLLPQIEELYPSTKFEYVPVSSNVEACYEHQNSKTPSIAVTNQCSAEMLNLPVRLVLNNEIQMPWLFMQRNDQELNS